MIHGILMVYKRRLVCRRCGHKIKIGDHYYKIGRHDGKTFTHEKCTKLPSGESMGCIPGDPRDEVVFKKFIIEQPSGKVIIRQTSWRGIIKWRATREKEWKDRNL